MIKDEELAAIIERMGDAGLRAHKVLEAWFDGMSEFEADCYDALTDAEQEELIEKNTKYAITRQALRSAVDELRQKRDADLVVSIDHQLQSRASVQNHRAKKQGVAGEHNADDIKRQYRLQKGKCWWCNEPVYLDFEVDHRVPLAQGGTNSSGNLVISCPDCNLKKRAQMPHEFNGRLL